MSMGDEHNDDQHPDVYPGTAIARPVIVDQATGEMLGGLPAVLAENAETPATFNGIGQVGITPEQAAKLMAEIPAAQIQVLPTGEAYLPAVDYRRKLNEVFGPGNWGIRPVSPPDLVDGTVMQMFALYINGRFVSEAPGESDYNPGNKRTSKATALESAKSNAIMRNCKELGIAAQCWDKVWTAKFKQEHCVKVWAPHVWNSKARKEGAYAWRRKDGEPFEDETGGDAQPARSQQQRPAQQAAPRDQQQSLPAGGGDEAEQKRKLAGEIRQLCEEYATRVTAMGGVVDCTPLKVLIEASGFSNKDGKRFQMDDFAKIHNVSLKWLGSTRGRIQDEMKKLPPADMAQQPYEGPECFDGPQ